MPDAQDIAKRIEENENARAIYHRIRDVMRRLRLGAPSVSDGGGGLNSNTVAESSTTNSPPAACPISKRSAWIRRSTWPRSPRATRSWRRCSPTRRRLTRTAGSIYQLPQVATRVEEESRKESATPAGDGRSATPALQTGRQKPTVPEYLRDTPKNCHWGTAVALLLLAGCFLGIVLLAFGQFDQGSFLRNTWDRLFARAPARKPETYNRLGETTPTVKRRSLRRSPPMGAGEGIAGQAQRNASLARPRKEKATPGPEEKRPPEPAPKEKAAVQPGTEPGLVVEPSPPPEPISKTLLDAKPPIEPGAKTGPDEKPGVEPGAKLPDEKEKPPEAKVVKPDAGPLRRLGG